MIAPETPFPGGIAVALDGTSLAESALDLAARMAHRFDAKVVLVTVLDRHVVHRFRRFCEGELVTLDEAVEAYQGRMAEAIRDRGLKVERHIVGTRHGPADDAIVDLVDRVGASLIVIGSHGRSGAARLFLGSVAEAVARHASVPVLIVRPFETRAAATA